MHFLLPKGESPNTSDMSLPDDGTTDADTAIPNSEPLMLNVEEDSWQLIEFVWWKSQLIQYHSR